MTAKIASQCIFISNNIASTSSNKPFTPELSVGDHALILIECSFLVIIPGIPRVSIAAVELRRASQFSCGVRRCYMNHPPQYHKTVITERRSMYGVTFLFFDCKTVETSTPDVINFRGDEETLNINRFYWNLSGFVFATSLTLWRAVTVTFQKFEK